MHYVAVKRQSIENKTGFNQILAITEAGSFYKWEVFWINNSYDSELGALLMRIIWYWSYRSFWEKYALIFMLYAER